MDDLPILHRWLQDPEVQRWFQEDDLSAEGIAAEYGPRIRGTEPEEQWFAVVDGRERAWLQTYPLTAWADYAAACESVGVDPAGGGLDYLVGGIEERGRGLGPLVIRAFVEEVVFGGHPDWPVACAGPHPDNVRSWRALEKAGFHLAGLIDTDEGPERLMVIGRPLLVPDQVLLEVLEEP